MGRKWLPIVSSIQTKLSSMSHIAHFLRVYATLKTLDFQNISTITDIIKGEVRWEESGPHKSKKDKNFYF